MSRGAPRRGAGARGRAPRPAAAVRPPVPPAVPAPPVSHPAMVAALVLTAVAILVSVTYPLFDTDLWQHLTVGRAIWTLHQVPTLQLWSWPTYGQVDVTSSYSWLFRAVIWPVWHWTGVRGLFAWRWATTLAAFALVWLAARRMGARGFATLLVIGLAALTYRQRAQVRPETLAAVLLGLEIWILEVRRHGGPDRSLWLIALLWLWANAHVSYDLGFAILGIHLLGDLWARARGRPAVPAGATRTLLLAGVAAAALAFVNPYGWRALWQPFDFLLHGRHEAILRSVGELMPPAWRDNVRNGLPLLVGGWPLLILWRGLRRRFDLVEALLCALFTPLALSSQRFLSLYALVAAPFLARDLEEAIAAVRLPAPLRSPPLRAAAACLALLGAGLSEWRRPEMPPGLGFDWRGLPVAACDFIQSHGIGGRGFTPYAFGGYLLWRFWPERDRLPFMDIHQSGTPAIRRLYQDAFVLPAAWSELDRRWRFDYVLLARVPLPGETLLDRLDADTTWALVFLDDAAALYVRRDGRLARIARAQGYRWLPAGPVREAALSRASARDPALGDSLTAELERQARESRWCASAWNLIGWIANERHQDDRARDAFARAVEVNETLVPGAHGMLARIALRHDQPAEALREIAAERRVSGPDAALDALEGRAWRAEGDRRRAREAWRRALRRDPGLQDARDSLEALGGG